jgi:hypothetical protein
MWLKGVAFAGLCGLIVTVSVRAAQDPAAADATAMAHKLEAIINRSEAPPKPPPKSLRTTFTDREVNAYFKVNSKDLLPEGVKDANVAIDEGGKVRAQALVRLDEALQTKKRSWYDPMAYLSGTVLVTATGRLEAADGKGTFVLDGATLGSVPVSTSVVLMLVNYYTRTPETPQGFDLDKPFPLPASIRSVETKRGAATIVQ